MRRFAPAVRELACVFSDGKLDCGARTPGRPSRYPIPDLHKQANVAGRVPQRGPFGDAAHRGGTALEAGPPGRARHSSPARVPSRTAVPVTSHDEEWI